MKSSILLLGLVVLAILAETTSAGSCFTFKKEDEKTYVRLHPLQDKVLNDFTVDFTYEFSGATKDAYMLSYATSKHNNEFLIGQGYGGIGSKSFFRNKAYFSLLIKTSQRITVTRIKSEISVYANGKFVYKKNLATPIRPGGSWILGQEQDTIEGKFDKTQRFIGKICDFQMWNYGMNPDSLKKLFLSDGSINAGNVFNSPPTYAFEKKNGATQQTCFTFKKEDQKAYVKLTPLQDKVLKDFTVDFTYEFSDATSDPYMVSYATSKHNNEFLIGQPYGGIGSKSFYRSKAYFPLSIKTSQRVTVTRIKSKISVYANGKLVEKTNLATPIRSGGSWILGQEQDAIEGRFDKNQRFIGKICDFQMWNYGMNPDSLKKLFLNDGSVKPGNIFNSPPSYAFKKRNGAM